MGEGLLTFRLIFGGVDVVVAIVIALVVGTINRIALNQRMGDFGLLYAIGHSRRWLVRRLTLETSVAAGAGWIAGLVLSWLLFAWLKYNLFAPIFDMIQKFPSLHIALYVLILHNNHKKTCI